MRPDLALRHDPHPSTTQLAAWSTLWAILLSPFPGEATGPNTRADGGTAGPTRPREPGRVAD